MDGNERIALHITDLFLYLNGVELVLTQDEAFELVLDVAKGLADLDEIESRLRAIKR